MAMMDDALTLAQSICWDEGYGYREGGHCASYADGTDCGGLVFHCLNAAGYSVSDTSPGVRYMNGILSGIGFNVFPYSGNLSDLKHGDIITMVHWENGVVTAGHTTFICENITAYTDPTADSDAVGTVSLAKVEGSSTRGHITPGDHQKNGTGAYWEVWCHAFTDLYNHNDYVLSDVYVCRDPTYNPIPFGDMLIFRKMLEIQRKHGLNTGVI